MKRKEERESEKNNPPRSIRALSFTFRNERYFSAVLHNTMEKKRNSTIHPPYYSSFASERMEVECGAKDK
jgi:hypothetical protein